MKKPEGRRLLKALAEHATSAPATSLLTAQAKFSAFFARMGAAASIQGLDAVPVSSLHEALGFITRCCHLMGTSTSCASSWS